MVESYKELASLWDFYISMASRPISWLSAFAVGTQHLKAIATLALMLIAITLPVFWFVVLALNHWLITSLTLAALMALFSYMFVKKLEHDGLW